MGLPTQPLTLSTGTLATLQARQSLPPRPRAEDAPDGSAPDTAATPAQTPPFTGRGRLVDIIA